MNAHPSLPTEPEPPRDRTADARALLAEMTALRDRVAQGADARMAGWRPLIRDESYLPSARNLAEYLALRDCDLTPLQPRLTGFGLSSLGRAEAHVAASLDAVIAALSAIAGEAAAFPDPARMTAADRRIAARRDGLFGPGRHGSRTRIMVTLPSEAAEDEDLLDRMVAAGADAVRINCAHDDAAAWDRMAANARRAGDAAGCRLAVEMDLGGPKLRTADIVHGKTRLHPGDLFQIVAALDRKSDLPQATLTQPAMLDLMVPGTSVWIDDGKLRAEVEEAAPGSATLRVTSARAKGARLKPEKGVSLPGVDLAIPALTDQDRADLSSAAHLADLIAFSFVQTVEDVSALSDALDAEAPAQRPALILKIETPLAVRNLPDLIVAAAGRGPAGVMIARGDLAVALGFERLGEMQEEILWLCEAAHVPVIWATQVLEGLIKEGQASRAETTDAAMSQRAECVMLNKGPFQPEAVGFLHDILSRMDRHADKKTERMGPLQSWRG